MMNHMKQCGVYNIPTTLNDYNESVALPPVLVATIDMAISVLTGTTINSNSVSTSNSTHIGITDYKGLNVNQQIVQDNDTYTIDFINGTGRKVLVYLKRCKPNE